MIFWEYANFHRSDSRIGIEEEKRVFPIPIQREKQFKTNLANIQPLTRGCLDFGAILSKSSAVHEISFSDPAVKS